MEENDQLEKEYIYAVTRIHGQDQRLLSERDMERLLAAKDVGECFVLLSDKGWATAGIPVNDPEALFELEREKTWALVRELTGELPALNIFRYENDFHNLKAAIKLVYTDQDEQDAARYFRRPGTVEPKAVLEAARRHDFDGLPKLMAEAGRSAHEVLIHTADGQACDMVIDRAALLAIDAEGKSSSSGLIRFYAELKTDAANIKAAVRGCRMGKDADFLARAIAPAGSLDSQALISAKSLEDIYAYLSGTAYAGAGEALLDSLAAFERWCDDRLMARIRPLRYEYFSVEPLVAYILARESEIAMTRLILSAKANRLDGTAITKRWRQTYV